MNSFKPLFLMFTYSHQLFRVKGMWYVIQEKLEKFLHAVLRILVILITNILKSLY